MPELPPFTFLTQTAKDFLHMQPLECPFPKRQCSQAQNGHRVTPSGLSAFEELMATLSFLLSRSFLLLGQRTWPVRLSVPSLECHALHTGGANKHLWPRDGASASTALDFRATSFIFSSRHETGSRAFKVPIPATKEPGMRPQESAGRRPAAGGRGSAGRPSP